MGDDSISVESGISSDDREEYGVVADEVGNSVGELRIESAVCR